MDLTKEEKRVMSTDVACLRSLVEWHRLEASRHGLIKAKKHNHRADQICAEIERIEDK